MCISGRECRKFEEGLDNNVKLLCIKSLGRKFRSGTQGLNEELGRHRGREGKSECTLCGAECESVVHVLWECTAYNSSRASFMEKLQELLGDSFADFDLLRKRLIC